jgi:ABC-type cobalamin transport system permease subunit
MILRLLYWVISFVLGSALKRILVGAGLAIASSQIILSIINVYINKALSGMSTGASSAMAFLGLSGADVAISILIGALIARATMEAMNLGLKKVTA